MTPPALTMRRGSLPTAEIYAGGEVMQGQVYADDLVVILNGKFRIVIQSTPRRKEKLSIGAGFDIIQQKTDILFFGLTKLQSFQHKCSLEFIVYGKLSRSQNWEEMMRETTCKV